MHFFLYRTVGLSGANVNHHAKVATLRPIAHKHNWAHHWDHHLPHFNRDRPLVHQAAWIAGPAINHHTSWVHILMFYRQRPAHTVRLQLNTERMSMKINCFHCVNISIMAVRRGLPVRKLMIKRPIITTPSTIIHAQRGNRIYQISARASFKI